MKTIRVGSDHARLCETLRVFCDDRHVVYVEGGAHDRETCGALEELRIPPKRHVEPGSIWPRNAAYHLPADAGLGLLSQLFEELPVPEVADHLVIYCDDGVLLSWYDVADAPCEVVQCSDRLEQLLVDAGFEVEGG